MRLEELDFECPGELIAQVPADPRDSCRLLYLTASGAREHLVFSDLAGILRPGDTLVFNNSRVLPARVAAWKLSGGFVELLFLRQVQDGATAEEQWEVLARPSHRLRAGGELRLPDEVTVVLTHSLGEGRWVVTAPSGCSMMAVMEAHGRLPVPPYIKRYPDEPSYYQTVYASVPGSAAAPTAGLHFTSELLRRLTQAGMKSAEVTLHVGLDTFLPIREEIVEHHRIHTETWSVGQEALQTIRKAVSGGDRVIAVGTTAARVLETMAATGWPAGHGGDGPRGGSTSIFITPGHRFRLVDALLTNFHLPRSSVLALTMAFAGTQRLRKAYAEAIGLGYRFFSFGDAMLIERPGGAEKEGDADALS
jgi:S-adenosylmethionine:tRNA ribosyltransferase-isomerase